MESNIQTTEYLDLEEQHSSREPDMEKPPYGKGWKRKSDGIIYTSEVYLGELYFLNGVALDEPIKEKPEDFELVDLIEDNII